MKKTNPLFNSLRAAGIVIIAIIIYAYGFEVTKVSFDEISSPRRQQSLFRVVRALFRPDFLVFDKVETPISISFYTPCPSAQVNPMDQDQTGPYLVVDPVCAEPRSQITVEGFNLPTNSRGQLYFIPPSEVNLSLGTYQTDEKGYFKLTAKVPPRPNEQMQYVRTIITKNVGTPSLSRSATDTWDKIVETVFLALLATTFGVLFAVPVSFFAARNLMREITTTVNALSLAVIGWLAGMAMGGLLANGIKEISEKLIENWWLPLGGMVISGLLIWLILRLTVPEEEEAIPSLGQKVARNVGMLVAGLLGIFSLYLFASLMIQSGSSLSRATGFGGMMGSFILNLGEILGLLIAIIGAIAGGTVVSGALARFGRNQISPLTKTPRLIVNLVLGTAAGAIILVLLGMAINWIYQINNPMTTVYIPAAVGAALGLLIVVINREKDSLAIGMSIYIITRTVLNGLRAIEALIWVIIFVVWVGIGPFAGVLALGLHTIASLAKLYSEQVESIMPGPLEAIKATGATRLQVIVYSVIPQIIPLYISFTMYRWDINVRMSTIIGFAGGGGIGFLLQQNINLLNYRAASVQMIAIAVVVAAMDYLSSYMREKIV